MGVLGMFKQKKQTKEPKKSAKRIEKVEKVNIGEENEEVKPVIAKEEILVKPIKIEKRADPEAYKIIMKPLITEKATELIQLNKYCFVVPTDASKATVIEKIKNIYGVKPVKVNFIMRPGRIVKSGRHIGTTRSFKKAIVTLAPGQKIEIYEGV